MFDQFKAYIEGERDFWENMIAFKALWRGGGEGGYLEASVDRRIFPNSCLQG